MFPYSSTIQKNLCNGINPFKIKKETFAFHFRGYFKRTLIYHCLALIKRSSINRICIPSMRNGYRNECRFFVNC